MALTHQFIVQVATLWQRPQYLLALPITALFVCVIWRAVYLLYFHPLAKYPGPLLAKFSNSYCAYHAWKGDMHIDMWRCHLKYGNWVRYGPDKVMCNTAEGLRDLYAVGKNVTKSRSYNAMVHREPNTFTLRDRAEAAKRRRIMSQGLSEGALRQYQQKILSHVQKFCNKVGGDTNDESNGVWTRAQNMSSWCNYLAFDLMTDIVFDLKFNLLGDATYRHVPESLEGSNVRTSVLLFYPKLLIRRMDKKLMRSAIKARDNFVKFINMVVRVRFQTKDLGSNDIFSILMRSKDPETGKNLTESNVAAEAPLLVVAGSDTTSTSMASTLFYLSRHQKAYERVVSEVRGAFASTDDVKLGPTLKSCVYLKACVDEAMRLAPPVAGCLFREAEAGGVVVDQQFIPEGYEVGTCIYSIHHNEHYFSDPFEYRPERWLVEEGASTAAEVQTAQTAYTPFSMGPRVCMGKNLAIAEILLTLSSLIMRYDFKRPDGQDAYVGGGSKGAEFGRHRPDEFQLRDHVTSAKNGPMVQFRRHDAKTLT